MNPGQDQASLRDSLLLKASPTHARDPLVRLNLQRKPGSRRLFRRPPPARFATGTEGKASQRNRKSDTRQPRRSKQSTASVDVRRDPKTSPTMARSKAVRA